jgi:hypothetical protein
MKRIPTITVQHYWRANSGLERLVEQTPRRRTYEVEIMGMMSQPNLVSNAVLESLALGAIARGEKPICEPANRACATTTRRYCRACPRS